MKHLNTLLIVLFAFTFVSAQTEAEQMEMMKKWEEYKTPGWAHEMLASSAGEWTATTKMWMQPGAEPQVSEGKLTNEMILGGRYLKSQHSGKTPWGLLEGMSLEGFDNATKEFTTIWIDNFGTGTMVLKGKYDKAAKTITYTGKMVDPILGKEIGIKETIKYEDKDTQFMEMFVVSEEGEFKTMEIKFERIK